ncbi:hypothetical protein OC835_002104 [Tilletia horrida]|nr:hypothetical protein OC835_002104 [Tilletia horrida]
MSQLHDVRLQSSSPVHSSSSSSSSSSSRRHDAASSSSSSNKRGSTSSDASSSSDPSYTHSPSRSSTSSVDVKHLPAPPSRAQQQSPSVSTAVPVSAAEYVRNNREPMPHRSRARKLLNRAWLTYHRILCTSPLSVMEPWERLLVLSLFFAISGLLAYYLLFHLPLRLVHLADRTAFYLYGTSRTVLARGAAVVHSSSTTAAAAAASILNGHALSGHHDHHSAVGARVAGWAGGGGGTAVGPYFGAQDLANASYALLKAATPAPIPAEL